MEIKLLAFAFMSIILMSNMPKRNILTINLKRSVIYCDNRYSFSDYENITDLLVEDRYKDEILLNRLNDTTYLMAYSAMPETAVVIWIENEGRYHGISIGGDELSRENIHIEYVYQCNRISGYSFAGIYLKSNLATRPALVVACKRRISSCERKLKKLGKY